MTLARKCDRCGKFYDPKTIESSFNAIITIDRDMANKYYSREAFDLCPNCLKSFTHWLKNEAQQFVPDLCWPVKFDTSKEKKEN